MKCNVGKTDRIFRAFIGIIIIVIGLYFQSWWGLVGIIPIATAVMGFCSFYVPFKLSTVKAESSKK